MVPPVPDVQQRNIEKRRTQMIGDVCIEMKRKILRSGVSVVCVLLVELLCMNTGVISTYLTNIYSRSNQYRVVPSKYGKVP